MNRQIAMILVSFFLLLGGIGPNGAAAADDGQSALGKTSINTNSFNDEFKGPKLGSQWEWYNEDPNKWSLTASPGYLRIIGANNDMWKTCANPKNLLLQKMPTGEFVMVAKLRITPTINYQQGGLLVFKDLDNYLKLGVVWNSTTQGGLGVEFILEKNGRPVREPDWPSITITSSHPAFIRIDRSGSVFTGYYSSDGDQWKQVGSWDAPALAQARIGLFALASSCRGNTPDIPVDFDYFRLTLGSRLPTLDESPKTQRSARIREVEAAPRISPDQTATSPVSIGGTNHTAAAPQRPTGAGSFRDRIVAVVNGDVLLASEMEKYRSVWRSFAGFLKGIETSAQASGDRELVDELVMLRLLEREAARKRVLADARELDRFVDKALKCNGMSRQQVSQLLKSQGISASEHRSFMQRIFKAHKLVTAEVTGKMAFTERDLQACFKANRDRIGQEYQGIARNCFPELNPNISGGNGPGLLTPDEKKEYVNSRPHIVSILVAQRLRSAMKESSDRLKRESVIEMRM